MDQLGEDKASGKKPFLQRMKEKWGLKNLWQVVLVLIVFAATGMTVVLIRPLIFQFLGIEDSSGWLKTVSYLLLVFPLYQALLLGYGFIFGQFHFFWEKEKKLAKALLKLFQVRRH